MNDETQAYETPSLTELDSPWAKLIGENISGATGGDGKTDTGYESKDQTGEGIDF